MAKLPVFPLNASSPPSSPKGEREGHEEEKKRFNHSGQSHQPLPGFRSGATTGGCRERKGQGRGLCGGKGLLSESQVRLLVGLHYLPHEHGPSAQKLLQDLTWLKSNCHLVSTNNKKSLPQKVPIRFLSNSPKKKKKFVLNFAAVFFHKCLRLMSGVVGLPGSCLCAMKSHNSTVVWWVGPTGRCSMTFTLTSGT